MNRDRRIDGAGTIERTPDRRFRPRLSRRFGRRYLEVCDTETAAEAALLAELEVLLDHPPEARTVAEWIEGWLDEREAAGHHRSIRGERGRFGDYVERSTLGRMAIAEVKPRHVRRWLAGLSHLAPNTQRNALSLVRSALRGAVEDELLTRNPARDVRVPRAAKAFEADAMRWLTLEEQLAAVAAAEELAAEGIRREAWPVAVTLAIWTGLRAGELWALRWVDVDLGAKVLRVTGAIGEDGRRGPPKSPRARREVPLLRPAFEALVAWQEACPESWSGAVLPSRDGGFHKRGYDSGWGRWIRKRAGLDVRWHDLRHTCASALLQGLWVPEYVTQPLRLEEVRDWLGHTSIETTQRYARLAGDGLRGLRVAYEGRDPERKVGQAGPFPKPEVAGSNPAGSATFGPGLGHSVGHEDIAAGRAVIDRYREAVENFDQFAHQHGLDVADAFEELLDELARRAADDDREAVG